jgi:hypothetical protein
MATPAGPKRSGLPQPAGGGLFSVEHNAETSSGEGERVIYRAALGRDRVI